jgi:ribosomal protein S18 acetylase RimI-like enzyme
VAFIRPARFPDDLPELRALLREYADSIGVDLSFQSFDAEMAGLPGDYAPPAGRLLILERAVPEDNTVAGCVALRRLEDEVCEMKRLWVRPNHQGHGLGRALAMAIIDEARRAGYARMRLDTLPSMTSAIALYQSLGFRPIAPYRPNPVAGSLFLELALTEAR